jgi:hypothetical protein
MPLESYYLPSQLEAQIGAFMVQYNYHRYHESLNTLTPANVYRGRAQSANASSNRQSDNDTYLTSNKPPKINLVDEQNPPLSPNAPLSLIIRRTPKSSRCWPTAE